MGAQGALPAVGQHVGPPGVEAGKRARAAEVKHQEAGVGRAVECRGQTLEPAASPMGRCRKYSMRRINYRGGGGT